MNHTSVNAHKCSIYVESKYKLPELSPLNSFKRVLRKMQTLRCPIRNHHEGRYLYKSEDLLAAECYRLAMYSPLLIHPYSWINVINVFIITHLWVIAIFQRTYDWTFGIQLYTYFFDGFFSFYRVMIIVHSMNQFITGYRQEKNVVIDFRRIAKRYLMTYFIIDLFDWLPVRTICGIFYDRLMCSYFKIRHVFLILRTPLFLQNLDTIFWVYGIPRRFNVLMKMMVIFVITAHLLTCLTNMIPYWCYGEVYAEYVDEFYEKGASERYVTSLHLVLGHCYSAVNGKFSPRNATEAIIFILILNYGFIYRMYLTTFVIGVFGKWNRAKNYYEVNLKELDNYLMRNKFSARLKSRILAHYRYKYQRRYFGEHVMFDNISEHLRSELTLNSRMHIIKTCELFKGLSITIVGQIIACIVPELYLPNEIIIRGDEPIECCYLINHGTVAIYTPRGNEILHLSDGNVLGVIGIYDVTNMLSSISIEFSEVYRWNFKDLTAIMNQSAELTKRFERLIKARCEEMQRGDNKMEEKEILYQLRNRKILEQQIIRTTAPLN